MRKLIASAASAVLLLSGCSSEQPAPEVSLYRFTDSTGAVVEAPYSPERTAVLFSSFADVWVTAGGSVEITVGEAVERGFADSSAVTVDAGAGKSIDVEALIAADPSFVICSADIFAQTEAAGLLRSAGVPCAVFRVECFADYLEMLKHCTEITGDSAAYEKYGTAVNDRINELLGSFSGSSEKEKILFIRSGSGTSSAKAKTAEQHFAAKMLEELGTYNIADNAPVLLDGLSIEEIITEDPAFIFISTMGNEEAAREYMDGLLNSEPWRALSAVKNKRCFYLPKELFQFKPNSRWDEAYRFLADILRSEEEKNG